MRGFPVQNSPLQVDESDAGEVGFSALSVRKSGTPPFDKQESVVQGGRPGREACYLGWQELLENLKKLVEPDIRQ